MITLNVSCPICKSAYKDSDDIYTTSCGHIFHFYCMNQWQSKSSSCPQCRSYNPTTHRIYLNIENTHEYENLVKDLKAKLCSSENEMKEIKECLKKKDQKIDDIKRLYNISEQWRAELENKIQALHVKNTNYDNELTLKLNEIQSLKTFMETLQNDNGVEELYDKIKKAEDELKLTTSRLNTENVKLKKNLIDIEASNMVLNHKIETQEQRIKHITLELGKQLEESVNKPTEVENIKPKLPQTKQRNPRHRKKEISLKVESKKILGELKSNVPNILNRKQHFELKQPNDSKVILTNFPKEQIMFSANNFVMKLAFLMSIKLSSDEILKTTIIESRRNFSTNNIALLVEFRAIEKKIEFLSKRNQLKSNLNTKQIQIKEYIDENIYPIFAYANRNLRDKGYEYICCKDNKVFAKKKKDDNEEIPINNKNDVDRLLSSERLRSLGLENEYLFYDYKAGKLF